ncbi:hypothetical protein K440DRAFT_419170 [Wilcoxina mikolae CBS 423.85]|nr:hypothetical protein K440DRAFT_419170 [Wilcoxina mikolae CBS 423.85]
MRGGWVELMRSLFYFGGFFYDVLFFFGCFYFLLDLDWCHHGESHRMWVRVLGGYVGRDYW